MECNRYLSLGILDLVQWKKNTSYINTACCHTKRLPYYVFNAREWNNSINHAQNCHCVSMHVYVWSCITNSTRAFQYLVTHLPINTHTLSVKIGSVQFTEFLPWNTWLHHNIGKSFSVSNILILWPWHNPLGHGDKLNGRCHNRADVYPLCINNSGKCNPTALCGTREENLTLKCFMRKYNNIPVYFWSPLYSSTFWYPHRFQYFQRSWKRTDK